MTRAQEDLLETYKAVNEMSEEELRQRLVELGQGPFLAGAPMWNLDKVQTAEDVTALRNEEGEGGSTDSESLALMTSACLRQTDWSVSEMRTLLKRVVYIVEASQFFAAVDKHTVGSYAGRKPLYPTWGSGAGGSSAPPPEGGYSLDRAALLEVIADLRDVVEGNMGYPWSIPAAELLAAGELDAAKYPDETVRVVCRELTYFKLTTVPTMWENKSAETEFASPVSSQ